MRNVGGGGGGENKGHSRITTAAVCRLSLEKTKEQRSSCDRRRQTCTTTAGRCPRQCNTAVANRVGLHKGTRTSTLARSHAERNCGRNYKIVCACSPFDQLCPTPANLHQARRVSQPFLCAWCSRRTKPAPGALLSSVLRRTSGGIHHPCFARQRRGDLAVATSVASSRPTLSPLSHSAPV